MHTKLVIKNVLMLMLLNGAAISGAHATTLTNEISRIGSTCVDAAPQLGAALEEHPSGALYAFGNVLGVPSSITDKYFDDGQATKSNSNNNQTATGASVNSLSCDGLMAALSNAPLVVDLSNEDKGLASGADALISQSKAVPLPAAAWLFSSALLGFIVVANRRKV
ncbi:hypothetical protein EJA72_10590 [Pseudomonas sp. PB120]|uniref:hypothetical protein n=1 Tax=Pseudomonas sp. PB120 TaxID=2494700 RepID=UPI0012FD2F95|nr:hypothetical protein [Pseudomonas sp. PB120]MVV48685.1 hypothetical protein [Pseudomonas sp. PB120]